MSARVVGVLGGSFDPPHCGHVLFAAYARSVAPIDEVLVVPTFEHPFGKRLSPFAHRVAMCERAFGPIDSVRVSRLEAALGGPSYTVRTLEALHDAEPDASFRLLIGADVAGEVHRWKDFDRVEALAPPFVVGRGGHDRVLAPGVLTLPEVSSTEVRARLASGADVVGLVPRLVAAYIEAHGLYRA